MPRVKRIKTAEFVVAAMPQARFSIDENSTREDFVEAVAVAAIVATGKIDKATAKERAFCDEYGELLLAEADARWGEGTAQQIAVSVALAVLTTRKAEAKYGSPQAAKARLERIGTEAFMAEVGVTFDQASGALSVDPGPSFDDEVL
jgi:hypothetical protein